MDRLLFDGFLDTPRTWLWIDMYATDSPLRGNQGGRFPHDCDGHHCYLRPKLRNRLKPAQAGRLVNDLREIAEVVETLPMVEASSDPYDNYLVTGDKPHLPALG